MTGYGSFEAFNSFLENSCSFSGGCMSGHHKAARWEWWGEEWHSAPCLAPTLCCTAHSTQATWASEGWFAPTGLLFSFLLSTTCIQSLASCTWLHQWPLLSIFVYLWWNIHNIKFTNFTIFPLFLVCLFFDLLFLKNWSIIYTHASLHTRVNLLPFTEDSRGEGEARLLFQFFEALWK